jgi:hypothetical protein
MSERLAALGATAAIEDEALGAEARATVAAEGRGGRRLPGFGIPLHAADPCAPLMLEIARREGTFGLYCRFAVALERALADARGGKPIPMNLDGVGAAIVLDLGFPLGVDAHVPTGAADRQHGRALSRGTAPGHGLASHSRRSHRLRGVTAQRPLRLGRRETSEAALAQVDEYAMADFTGAEKDGAPVHRGLLPRPLTDS